MRPSKLTLTEAAHLKSLRDSAPVPVLAKRFNVSKSTVYRVFDGSYKARMEDGKTMVQRASPFQTRQSQALSMNDFDDLTLATVQFVLAKTQLQRHLGSDAR